MTKNKTKVIEGQVLTPEVGKTSIVKLDAMEKALAHNMPKWVAEKEDVGNAMYKTAQEIWLVMEDALIKHHGFSQEKLRELRNQITPVLQGVTEYESKGLSLLTPFSIDVVSDLVQTHLTKEQLNRTGLEYPVQVGAAPFIKALKERNHDE